MPPTCRICRREDRDQIDVALLSGTPFRDMAGRFGTSKSGLERHRAHVSAKIAKAHEEGEKDSATIAEETVVEIEAATRRFIRRAERSGDLRTAIAGLRELGRMAALRLATFAARPASRDVGPVTFTVDVSADDGYGEDEDEPSGPRLLEQAPDEDGNGNGAPDEDVLLI